MMKTMKKTRTVFAGLVLASSGLLATGVSADPIAAWDWQSDGGFIDSTATCDDGSAAPGTCSLQLDNTSGETPSGIDGTSSVMSWGTPSTGGSGEQSGLQGVFGASVAPDNGPFDAQLLGSGSVPIPEFEQIVTNGDWTNTGAAVHYNNVITQDGGALGSATLRTSFQLLTPTDGPVNLVDLEIDFNETENEAPCTEDNPHGTECDDIFTLTGGLDPINFTIDGQAYLASFQLLGGDGAIVTGDTIYTAELSPGTAIMYVQARIETIPLPGVLALMGMGLMMIGFQVRGRRKLV